MKKTLELTTRLAFALALLLTMNCKQEEPFYGYTIKGTVKGLDTGWVKVIKPNYTDRENARIVIDSAQIQNGLFEMKGKVAHVDMMDISIDERYRTRRGFLLENSPITIEIDISTADKIGRFEALVSGSKMHDAYVAQNKKDNDIFEKEKYASLNALREEGKKAYDSKDETLIAAHKEKFESLAGLMNERQEEYQNAKIKYVLDNPSSPVAPYVLAFQFSEGRMAKDKMKKVYNALTGDAKNTAMYGYIKKTYTEVFESFGVGATVPDFTLTTLQGEDLSLSEVEGKYILIDFWASWCVPCRASFPHLKELYAKYNKNGFEVVGIGTADAGSKWKKAIEEDQTEWKHVFDGDVNEEGNGKGKSYGPVAKTYGVPFLPTTFLIDSERKIVARQIRGKDIDKMLTELFGY